MHSHKCTHLHRPISIEISYTNITLHPKSKSNISFNTHLIKKKIIFVQVLDMGAVLEVLACLEGITVTKEQLEVASPILKLPQKHPN